MFVDPMITASSIVLLVVVLNHLCDRPAVAIMISQLKRETRESERGKREKQIEATGENERLSECAELSLLKGKLMTTDELLFHLIHSNLYAKAWKLSRFLLLFITFINYEETNSSQRKT